MAKVTRPARKLSDAEEAEAEQLSHYIENLRPKDLGNARPGPGYRGRPSLTAKAAQSPSIHVRLPAPLYAELSKQADSAGITVSSVVRDILKGNTAQPR